ncbi:hypothetical protein AB0O67_31645 [Streptomyces sp. NPDC086077]|uniref:class I SAM-dependent methyltransferase n=1 Tax=Streptomyces sp. NPDC086077 TaxID=3154862 RepID=UPI0034140B2D
MERIARHLLAKCLGRPSGPLGRLGGRLMAHGNAATERHVVSLAAPAEQDVVLVVGPGPGVGLAAAAERSAHVIGIEPSDVMLAMARRRCARLIRRGRLRLSPGTAASGTPPDPHGTGGSPTEREPHPTHLTAPAMRRRADCRGGGMGSGTQVRVWPGGRPLRAGRSSAANASAPGPVPACLA